MTTITLDDVTRSYRGFTLGPVTTSFETGVTALLGANGAGKSTLLRIITAITTPSSGTITVNGTPLRQGAGHAGYLPQDFTGPRRVRTRDYLRYIAWCRSTRRHTITLHDVDAALDRVGLTDRADYRIGALSGGMVRRLGIAQAILGGTSILVLDEPTVGLDPVQRRELRDVVADIATDATVILSTHLSEDVAAIAAHVRVLDHGHLTFTGPIDQLTTLGGSNTITGESVERGFLATLETRTSHAA